MIKIFPKGSPLFYCIILHYNLLDVILILFYFGVALCFYSLLELDMCWQASNTIIQILLKE